MPNLPLNFSEPILATYGIMLFPEDERTALAYAAQRLGKPLKLCIDAGGEIPNYLMAEILVASAFPVDIKDRRWGGSVTGEMLKVLWALNNTNPAYVSWNKAIAIVRRAAAADNAEGTRKAPPALQLKAKKQFLSVAHLWAAWEIRGRQIGGAPEADSGIFDDFLCFLAEAETLRQWGQSWRPAKSKSEPLLPAEMWCVPDYWAPPDRPPGWLPPAALPLITLSAEQMADLRLAGRPRKTS